MGRLALGGSLALPLLLGGRCLGNMILLVVIGGRNVVSVALAIRFGINTARGARGVSW